jgi:hypothetical protein
MRNYQPSDTERHVRSLIKADRGNFDANLAYVVFGLSVFLFASKEMIDPWMAVMRHQVTPELKEAFWPIGLTLLLQGVALLWAAWSLKTTAKRHAGRNAAISERLREPSLDQWSRIPKAFFPGKAKRSRSTQLGAAEGQFDARLAYLAIGSIGLAYVAYGVVEQWIAVFSGDLTPSMMATSFNVGISAVTATIPMIWSGWKMKEAGSRHAALNAGTGKRDKRLKLDSWSTLLIVFRRSRR